MSITKLARGYRNHNPLNIIKNKSSMAYKGVSKVQTDINFLQFDTTAYGFRAAYKLLHRYYHVYKLQTIRQMVTRWCPDHTAKAYTESICNRTGLDADTVYPWNVLFAFDLVMAMAYVENGGILDSTPHDAIHGWQLFTEDIKTKVD